MCATTLESALVGGRFRKRCPGCRWIHFRDPGVGASVLLRDDQDRVLLVRRGPGSTQEGRWCLPCGFVDYGEDIREAAAREVLEETGLEVMVSEPIRVESNFHDPAKLTVGVWFEGRVLGGSLEAGDDADAVDWFALEDLPELAFDTDAEILQRLKG